jgi:type IV secretory pathway VirB10-like protein
VVIASTRAGQDAAAVALQNEANLSPTIRVDPGAQLRIFVTRDIDFSRVVGP